MRTSYLAEIILTTSEITAQDWLVFQEEIAVLNGKFRHWDLWITIEKNIVRYFIKTHYPFPTTLQSTSSFLIKQIEEPIKPLRKRARGIYLVLNRVQSILDLYDRNETRRKQKLIMSQIRFWPYRKDHSFTKANFFFQSPKGKVKKKKALFLIPHLFCIANFAKYQRFTYAKEANKYLDIQKSLSCLQPENHEAVLAIDAFPYLAGKQYLNLDQYDFDSHSLIVGGSGTGKSKFIVHFIATLANEEWRNNYKVIVIDPHAALKDEIGGLPNTSVRDFQKEETSVDLFMNTGQNLVASTNLILSLFQTLMADQYNSKLERVLMHSIHLLLTKHQLTFGNLRKLILEINYRNELLEGRENLPDSIINFFYTDFNELKTKSYQEAISPILAFIDELQLLPAFSKQDNQKHQTPMKQVLEDNFLTLFSLDEAKLGEKVMKTIAAFLMQQLLELLQAHTFSKHIILIIDEVAVVENPMIKRFLAEARKYQLSIILAQQYFSQISEDLRKSIAANCLNYYVFRVSKEDAYLLEGNLLIELSSHNHSMMRAKVLAELANRECIVRISKEGKVLRAMKGKTLTFEPIPLKHRNQILITEGNIKKEPKELKQKLEDFAFSLDQSFDLVELMRSQSTSRKKVTNHG